MQNIVDNLFQPSHGIPRQLAEGIRTRLYFGENAMLSAVRLDPKAIVKRHHHAEEQWSVLIEGACTLIMSGEETLLSPGDFWLSSPGVDHEILNGDEPSLILDVFSPPREDLRPDAIINSGRKVA